jgi:hypothetical protein
MNLERCAWCGADPLYVRYHDEEWGVPVHDDHRLFEMLVLDGAQAGLSWLTILRKREHYRPSVRPFRPGTDRPLRRAATVAESARRSRHRAQPPEDRSGGQERQSLSGAAGTARRPRHVSLALRRWRAQAKRLALAGGSPRAHGGSRGDEPRSETARFFVRRSHDLLRLHASGRHGQRSHHRLLSSSGTGETGFAGPDRLSADGQIHPGVPIPQRLTAEKVPDRPPVLAVLLEIVVAGVRDGHHVFGAAPKVEQAPRVPGGNDFVVGGDDHP